MEQLGTKYGGWWVPINMDLKKDSIVYSGGVGEDMSFDILLSENSNGSMYGTVNTQKSATGMSVGSTYKFSKRTNIYATYTAVENNSNAGFAASGSATNISTSAPAGSDPKIINIGMRHSF